MFKQKNIFGIFYRHNKKMNEDYIKDNKIKETTKIVCDFDKETGYPRPPKLVKIKVDNP